MLVLAMFLLLQQAAPKPAAPAFFSTPYGRGQWVSVWNAGGDDLLCTGYIAPVDNVEYFLTELYDSTKRNGGARPDPFEAAFLVTRYRSGFTMVEIPAAVQRLVFPIQVAIGKLLGRYRKYADAPEPVRR